MPNSLDDLEALLGDGAHHSVGLTNLAAGLPACLSLQERNEVLEKAFAEAQAQNSQHRAQMQDMQDSLKKATKVVQVNHHGCADVAADASSGCPHADSGITNVQKLTVSYTQGLMSTKKKHL